MQLPTFIKLENTLDKAMFYKNSPQYKNYYFGGIHLLPDNIYPYKQRTYANDGIELEATFVVNLMTICGTVITDITDWFNVTREFQDPDTGLPQIEWELLTVPYDAGFRLVYLEITQGANDKIYSSPFYFTKDNSDYTSQWFYRNKINEDMMSIGLQLYFMQEDDDMEVQSYNPVSSGVPFNAGVTIYPFEIWNSGVIDLNLYRTIKSLFEQRYLYSFDSNSELPIKTGLKEGFETPKREADENFGEQELSLNRNYGVTYDPLYIPTPVPPPPPDPPTINLNSIIELDAVRVQYTFTYSNFSPDYLTYQWSLDGVTWNNGYVLGIESPMIVEIYDHQENDFYYSIYHQGTGTRSNILRLNTNEIVILNITSDDTEFKGEGNLYNIFFTLGFETSEPLVYEASINNSDWVTITFVDGSNNVSPKQFITPDSSFEFTYFRIRYLPLGIVSNTFNYNIP